MVKKPIEWSKILGFLGIIFDGLGGMCDRLSERMERKEGIIKSPSSAENRIAGKLMEGYEE